MYHPTRGGVRGGRDQFSWDDVKVDKHRENYLGHSIKAPVGRWQKGKDLHWYARDKKSELDSEAMKDEIRRIKEEEEQAMREALGLAPKRASKSQGHRLDKHEFAELVKRGSTAEDVGAGHAEAAQVHGLGFARGGSRPLEDSSLRSGQKTNSVENPNVDMPTKMPTRNEKEESEDESSRKRKRRYEEKKRDKHEKHNKERRHHHHDSDDNKRKHKKDRERRRHDSK